MTLGREELNSGAGGIGAKKTGILETRMPAEHVDIVVSADGREPKP
jgi:hypothetical protein